MVSLAGVLAGIIPNCVVVNIVSSNTFNRGANNTMCHPLSSGAKRAIDPPPVVERMWINVGADKFPRNSQYLCNTIAGNFQSVQATYDEYRRSCIDEDKPFLSYLHWKNHFQNFVFNLTNDDSPMYSHTDQTRTGSLNLNIQFATTGVDYTITIVALQHASFYIDKTRNVSREGF